MPATRTRSRPPAHSVERARRLRRLQELSARPREPASYGLFAGRPADVLRAAALKALVGAWLLVSSFVVPLEAGIWNVLVAGLLLIVLVYLRPTAGPRTPLVYSAQLVIGVWLVVSAFWLHDSTLGSWNAAVTGIAVMLVAAWSLVADRPTKGRPAPSRRS